MSDFPKLKTVDKPEFPEDFANRLVKGGLRLIPVNWSCATMRWDHEGQPLFCILDKDEQVVADFRVEEVIPNVK